MTETDTGGGPHGRSAASLATREAPAALSGRPISFAGGVVAPSSHAGGRRSLEVEPVQPRHGPPPLLRASLRRQIEGAAACAMSRGRGHHHALVPSVGAASMPSRRERRRASRWRPRSVTGAGRRAPEGAAPQGAASAWAAVVTAEPSGCRGAVRRSGSPLLTPVVGRRRSSDRSESREPSPCASATQWTGSARNHRLM